MNGMRAFALLVLAVAMMVTGVVVQAQELHALGLIRETEMPDWVQPCPIDGDLVADELDEFVDNSPGLPPIGNQGGQGSCTAWATGYYWLTYMQGLDYGWDLTQREHQMSPAFIYNQINRGGDNGSSITDAFKLFEEVGCGRYIDMPYTTNNCTDFPPAEAFRNGMKFRTDYTYDINTGTMNGINQIRAVVATGGMAVIGISVYPNFDNIASYDYNYCVNDVYGELRGGHAVTIVGYDDERVTSDGVGAFKMVNSWGSGWGDNGFWWMSYEAVMSGMLCHGYAIYASDREQYEPMLAACIEPAHEDRYNMVWKARIEDDYGNLMFWTEAFDFGSWWGVAQHEYPEDACIWLDLTDGFYNLEPDIPNNVIVQGVDTGTYNGLSGEVEAVSIVDLNADFTATCYDMPVEIPDTGPGAADVPVTVYYAAVPPSDVVGEINLYNGEVSVSWPAIDEGPDFIEYNVYRDGELITQTTGTDYLDTVDEFGVYSYTVSSVWEPCQSAPSAPENVNYITGLAATYPEVATGEEAGDYVEFTLSWEQVRPWEVAIDDGSSEQPLTLNESCLPGSMIAQRVQIAETGLLTHVNTYIHGTTDPDAVPVNLVVLEDAAGNTPGALLSTSVPVDPVPNTWVSGDLGSNRVWVDEGQWIWLGIQFEEPGTCAIGYDNHYTGSAEKAICPDGNTWIPLTGNGGAAMLRATVGSEELVGGDTGLLGWEVYADGELFATVEDDSRQASGLVNVVSSHTFRVDALYQQGVWTGEDLTWMYTGVGEGEVAQPRDFSVSSAAPNPFNAMTAVSVTLPRASELTVDVLNLLGQRVDRLISGRQSAGEHRILFDASAHASGVYLLHVAVPGQLNEIRKVVYLK